MFVWHTLFLAAVAQGPSEAELNRWIFRALVIGTVIMAIGGTTLYFAFRAFGSARERGGEFRPILLLVALIAFLMVCSIVLLRLSILR
ncbi:MAG TPA: hypothetical protein VEZ11_11040 [Thermoanaerobaculia bacterium]|nr:hypothetical protein [Thermoanaerobaculia bacterium]